MPRLATDAMAADKEVEADDEDDDEGAPDSDEANASTEADGDMGSDALPAGDGRFPNRDDGTGLVKCSSGCAINCCR